MKYIFTLILSLFVLNCTSNDRHSDEIITKKETINWSSDNLGDVIKRNQSKPIMIDFYTDWCKWCKVLDEKTYTDITVGELSKQFINLKINAEVGDGGFWAQTYKVTGFPNIIFLNGNGETIHRINGYAPPKDFAIEMQKALDLNK
jgi:thioredoxin 1